MFRVRPNWPEVMQLRQTYDRIATAMFRRVDASTLAVFRVLFGALLVWETVRFWPRVQERYLATKCPFRFDYFEYLPTPSENGFYAILIVMGVSAGLLALGLWYRTAAACLLISYTYIFLLEQTSYNNHYYLTVLLCFFFFVCNANATFALGSRWDRKRRVSDDAHTVPFWSVFLFRGQMFVVYFYGGVAKINHDWLRCEPMRNMLRHRAPDFPIPRALTNEWVVHFFAYGGLLIDLLIGFLLLYRRTRALAVLLIVFFHITNNWLFDIGIFPWLAMAATVVFLEPATPRRLWRYAFHQSHPGSAALPSVDGKSLGSTLPLTRRQHWIVLFIAAYFAIQLLVPLRHFLYPGNVSWTEEGHNFAWHMKLRSKDGIYRFYVADPISQQITPVRQGDYLTERQQRRIATRPHLLRQFAHFLHDEYERQGFHDIEVYVRAVASLNGRPYQPLIDPTVNLAGVPRNLCGAGTWIIPLDPNVPIGDYPQTPEERVRRIRSVILRTRVRRNPERPERISHKPSRFQPVGAMFLPGIP